MTAAIDGEAVSPAREPDHLSRVAIRRLQASDGWEICGWRRIGEDGLIVRGGVPRLLKRGPNKGAKTWDGCETKEVAVTFEEIDNERARYEQETGKCGQCLGSSEVWASWSADEGHRFRPCTSCGASGKARHLDKETTDA